LLLQVESKLTRAGLGRDQPWLKSGHHGASCHRGKGARQILELGPGLGGVGHGIECL